MDLRPAWDELAARCLEPSVFAEASFVLPAAQHLATGAKPVVLAAWLGGIGGQLIGVAPVARSPVGLIWPAQIWTHPQAVAAIPLLDRVHAKEAWQAMLAAVGALRSRPAALLLGGVALAGPTAALLRDSGAQFLIMDERPRAVLQPGSVGVGLGSKTRKEFRRQWNRLAERGALSFAIASTPEAVGTALESFLKLEAKGWKGTGGTALGSRPGTRAFVRSAMRDLAARGQARFASLELAGEPIAMGIVLRSADRALFWKTAYDEDLARSSPGLQLTLWLTDQLGADRELKLVDSCAVPGHSMIDRVWPERITVGDVLVATGQSLMQRFDWVCKAELLRRRLLVRAKAVRAAWMSRKS